MGKQFYTVSSSPHIRSKDSIENIMVDVLIALTPATVMGVYFFGINALITIAISIIACVGFEALFQKMTNQTISVNDYSAAVTGLLLAMNLPPTSPIWMPIVGSFVAIVIVKQLFGGLGQNFMNPALAARAFLLAAYPIKMTDWVVDGVSSATPLAMMKENGFIPKSPDYINALIGHIGGTIGETCALALILGGLYLMARKVISWRIPVTYIGTVFVVTFIFGRNGAGLMNGVAVYELLTGGLLLGAFFMATDYSSSPITPAGQLIMGVGCGVLTGVIRIYGGYPEGVAYAILIMNLVVPLIDRFVKGRVFGEVRHNG